MVKCLASAGSAAKAALPILVQLTDDPDLSLRVAVQDAIGAIDPERKAGDK
jgi:hypothetical protein